MKITFVGSSHGVPEPHRQCSCTMIEVAGNTYFVDMGTCAINALRTRNIPVDSVKGIFLTHMHGDHSDGLIQFVDLLTWFFRPEELRPFSDLSLHVFCFRPFAYSDQGNADRVVPAHLRLSENHCRIVVEGRQPLPKHLPEQFRRRDAAGHQGVPQI